MHATAFPIFTVMNWILLIIAGLFEALFTFCLGKAKLTTGKTELLWHTGFVIALIISMTLLVKATQSLPIGTAYAVWTGIGAAGAVVLGILFLQEPVTIWRLVFLCTLIGSVVGLKYVSGD